MRKRKKARYNFPHINLPSLNLPKVELPKVDLPRAELPRLNLAKVNLPLRQIAIAGFLLFFALAMININSRLQAYTRLAGERDALKREVAALEVTSQSLETQLAYAVSDKAAEELARASHKVREGEHLIVVVTPQGGLANTATPVAASPDKAVQKWEVWWALFFGSKPN